VADLFRSDDAALAAATNKIDLSVLDSDGHEIKLATPPKWSVAADGMSIEVEVVNNPAPDGSVGPPLKVKVPGRIADAAMAPPAKPEPYITYQVRTLTETRHFNDRAAAEAWAATKRLSVTTRFIDGVESSVPAAGIQVSGTAGPGQIVNVTWDAKAPEVTPTVPLRFSEVVDRYGVPDDIAVADVPAWIEGKAAAWATVNGWECEMGLAPTDWRPPEVVPAPVPVPKARRRVDLLSVAYVLSCTFAVLAMLTYLGVMLWSRAPYIWPAVDAIFFQSW
jgi:hypothetical protein